MNNPGVTMLAELPSAHTSLDLAKKKASKPARQKPKKRAPAYVLYVRLAPAIGDALDDYIASLDPKPTTTAALESLLKKALAAVSHWPRRPAP